MAESKQGGDQVQGAQALDPFESWANKQTWEWGWVVAGSLIALVTAALTLGLVQLWFNSRPLLLSAQLKPETSLPLAGAAGETTLLLLKPDDSSSQLKLAKTTTDTVTIQNVIRERGQILTAALSPQEKHVVYIKEEGGYKALTVIDLVTGQSTPLERGKLGQTSQGIQIEPCPWSPLAWSPDGGHVAIFGCSRTASAVVVVPAETQSTAATVLKKTEAAPNPPRQLFWLDNASLIYTHLDTSTDQVQISRISIQADATPLAVYHQP